MILAVARALSHTVDRPVPAGLSRRISDLANRHEFEQFLLEVWKEASNTGKATAQQLETAALEGLCSVVPGDPSIIPAQELKVQQQLAANRYVGIGIQLALDEESHLPVIAVPFVGGPAHRAGVKPDDRILQIDGVSTENVTLDETVRRLRGEEGTKVTLVLKQPDAKETHSVEITRGVVPLESVVGYRRTTENTWDYRPIASEPIGYVWIQRVVASTLHELRQAARVLEGQDVRALVIDLRNVPGGELQHFLRIADELLGESLVGRSRDARGTVTEYRSGPDSLFPRWPIVLLVNGFTASAAEFLAAALQDNQRAVIVGEPTPGECCIRQRFELPDDFGAIVLLTGTLERPDGRPMHRPEYIERIGHTPTRASAPPIPPNAAQSAAATIRGARGTGHTGSADQAGGVRPDHVLELDGNLREAWMKWRHLQELPDPSPTADSAAPVDPQLGKAMELLHAMLKSEQG